jgi:hypothetical protein
MVLLMNLISTFTGVINLFILIVNDAFNTKSYKRQPQYSISLETDYPSGLSDYFHE